MSDSGRKHGNFCSPWHRLTNGWLITWTLPIPMCTNPPFILIPFMFESWLPAKVLFPFQDHRPLAQKRMGWQERQTSILSCLTRLPAHQWLCFNRFSLVSVQINKSIAPYICGNNCWRLLSRFKYPSVYQSILYHSLQQVYHKISQRTDRVPRLLHIVHR